MTTTSARDDQPAAPPSGAAPPAGFTPPPKLRRRPSLVAGGVVAICLGALLAAWAWASTTSTQEVLAAKSTIHRGEVIEADDLQRVRINDDPALGVMPASAFDAVVGQRAALDIAEGGLVTEASTTQASVPPQGQSVVGISLPPGRVPSVPLHAGDPVRVVVTVAEGAGEGEKTSTGPPAFTSATVVGTHVDEATGNTVVDVQVPYVEAGALAARTATGNVAIVLDSGEQ